MNPGWLSISLTPGPLVFTCSDVSSSDLCLLFCGNDRSGVPGVYLRPGQRRRTLKNKGEGEKEEAAMSGQREVRGARGRTT